MRVQVNTEREEERGATTAECPCGAEFVLIPADRFPLEDGATGKARCPACGLAAGWIYDKEARRLEVATRAGGDQ